MTQAMTYGFLGHRSRLGWLYKQGVYEQAAINKMVLCAADQKEVNYRRLLPSARRVTNSAAECRGRSHAPSAIDPIHRHCAALSVAV